MPEFKLDDWAQIAQEGREPEKKPAEEPQAPVSEPMPESQPKAQSRYTAPPMYHTPRPEPRLPGGSTALLRAMESRSSRDVFGGKLFSWADEEKGARMVGFAVTGQDDVQAAQRENEYRRLCDPYYRFLHYEGSVLAADCRVYLFRLPKDAVSLASLITDENRKRLPDAKLLLRQLLGVLSDHQSRFTPYVPLQCLSPYTVFLQLRSGEGPALLVLPLRTENGCYPVSVPRDQGEDISSDVYAAVHTICQYGCGVLSDMGGLIELPESRLLWSALLPASTNRPTLERLLGSLEGERIVFRRRPAANRQGSFWQRLTGRGNRNTGEEV